jgi:TPR repeat protein
MRLVKKGDDQLADGGIAQARLLYERAAEAGLAQGAMAMAATFDAVELERMGARGIKPDHEAARRWYERARQLGAVEAEQRLRRLGGN